MSLTVLYLFEGKGCKQEGDGLRIVFIPSGVGTVLGDEGIVEVDCFDSGAGGGRYSRGVALRQRPVVWALGSRLVRRTVVFPLVGVDGGCRPGGRGHERVVWVALVESLERGWCSV